MLEFLKKNPIWKYIKSTAFIKNNPTITRNPDLNRFVKKQLINTNGHEYVDLGLPSGTLWATCNLGASNPEEYGDYYTFGEVETKEVYNGDTWKVLNTPELLNKVQTEQPLGLECDAAHINWGGSWQTPSKEQLSELINPNYSNISIFQGQLLIESKINGNFIKLPYAGFKEEDTVKNAGKNLSVLSRDYTLDDGPYILTHAQIMELDYLRVVSNYSERFIQGFPIRPVISL